MHLPPQPRATSFIPSPPTNPKGVHLDVCSSSEGVVVSRLWLGDGQVPGRPGIPDALQVLAPISIRVECITFAHRHRLPSEEHLPLIPLQNQAEILSCIPMKLVDARYNDHQYLSTCQELSPCAGHTGCNKLCEIMELRAYLNGAHQHLDAGAILCLIAHQHRQAS